VSIHVNLGYALRIVPSLCEMAGHVKLVEAMSVSSWCQQVYRAR